MSRYVFISNSTKPSEEAQKSRKPVTLDNVNKPCLEVALSMGYEVWFGINRENPDGLKCELPIHMYDSHTYRSIFSLKDNIIAYKNLMLILNQGEVEVIHCNTPIGGVIGRICGKRAGVKKVIYTAHGFHFYKGAPLINGFMFRWAEMKMAQWTDAVITMNQEDYEAARKFKLRSNGKVYHVYGVGIDTENFKSETINRKELRASLGLTDTDFVCISMGDLIPRKNYSTAIKAIAKCGNKSLHYLICGNGPELKNLKALTKSLNVRDQIHFLGFRSDIKELLRSADIFLLNSMQEGLPRSLMEAMASGLPCVVSKIRGNVDLIKDGVGGYLCGATEFCEFAIAIGKLAGDIQLRITMGQRNLEKIKDYDVANVKRRIEEIYHEVILH